MNLSNGERRLQAKINSVIRGSTWETHSQYSFHARRMWAATFQFIIPNRTDASPFFICNCNFHQHMANNILCVLLFLPWCWCGCWAIAWICQVHKREREPKNNRYKRHSKMLTNGIWQQIVPLRMDFCCYRIAIFVCVAIEISAFFGISHNLLRMWLYFFSSKSICLWFFGHYSWDICFGNSFFSQHLMVCAQHFYSVKNDFMHNGQYATCSFSDWTFIECRLQWHEHGVRRTSIWHAFFFLFAQQPFCPFIEFRKYQCYGQTQFARSSFDCRYRNKKCVL